MGNHSSVIISMIAPNRLLPQDSLSKCGAEFYTWMFEKIKHILKKLCLAQCNYVPYGYFFHSFIFYCFVHERDRGGHHPS